MITETQAANVMGGKTARACDGCMRRRARWYCKADDAFLCQSCNSSVHSANQLASRHERVRLRTSSSSVLSLSPSSLSSSSELKSNKTIPGEAETATTTWYQGFTRKTRTPRGCGNKGLLGKLLQNRKSMVDDDINSNNPLVPELGREEGSTFSLSSMDENEENSNYWVPVFNPFSDFEIFKNENVHENNNFGFFLDGFNNRREGDCDEQMDDSLNGSLPLDVDLAEFAMDVESLLGEESCVDVKEQLGFPEFKEEDIEIKNDATLNAVKDEEEEEEEEAFERNLDCGSLGLGQGTEEEEQEEKGENCVGIWRTNDEEDGEYCKDEKILKRNENVFLRLDFEAVIAAWARHGSPWTTGRRPEFSPGDCWPDCMLQGYMCPKHVLSRCEETKAVGSMPRLPQGRIGVSDGEREARVLRYREKRRTRLFAKKIRYEVRKLNAEKRPRIKGRFVKRTSLLGK